MQYLVIHNNMKNYFILLTLLILLLFNYDVQAQKKIKESDVIGTWKLNIDVDEAIQEAKDELDEQDNIIGKIVLTSVSGFVDSIIEESMFISIFKKAAKSKF